MSGPTERLRVTIDAALCTGQGRCYRLAPGIFVADDEDKGHVQQETVSADQRGVLERAVQLCPEQAIRVEPVE